MQKKMRGVEILRVCEILEFSDKINEDRGRQEDLFYQTMLDLLSHINWERTRYLQSLPKYVAFKEWLEKNGVKYPSVEYPVAFGRNGELVGMAAKEDVPPLKAFLFVPHRLII
jgi:hypothetical protein